MQRRISRKKPYKILSKPLFTTFLVLFFFLLLNTVSSKIHESFRIVHKREKPLDLKNGRNFVVATNFNKKSLEGML